MQEEWKDIAGYPEYQVSNLGKVKSIERKVKCNNGYRIVRERILSAGNVNGYQQVQLCRDGKIKHILVHQLVARAFLPNPDNLQEVNHIDENKNNNHVSNLEWCTREYNMNYGTCTQRSAKKRTNGKKSKAVRCIETGVVYPSTKEVERQLGFAQGSICDCCRGKRCKTVGGYHWEYVA